MKEMQHYIVLQLLDYDRIVKIKKYFKISWLILGLNPNIIKLSSFVSLYSDGIIARRAKLRVKG